MATKKTVVATTQDIPSQIETLRADIAMLSETIKTQAKATVAAKSATAKQMTTKQAEAAKERYSEISSQAETSIKENPFTSIAIAIGAGIVLGAITRR